MSTNQNELPARTGGDVAHAVAKAILSAVPGIGGPAVELFQYVVQPPLEKRRDDWMRGVGEQLEELGKKGLDLSELQKNEQFISTVMQATQAAIRTHNAAKLDALRNAIVNVAAGNSPDETVQHIFLSLVDQLSEMHLRVLKVFHAPQMPPGLSMGGLDSVLHYAIPALREQRELGDKIFKDLYTEGLINTERMQVTMSGNGLTQRRTTSLGESLLAFIAGPEQ